MDFSSITGFATLGARDDNNLTEDVNDAGKESIKNDSSDYDLLHLEDIEDEIIDEDINNTPAENETDDNETVPDSPMILSGGGGGGSSGDDNPPIVDNPPVDDLILNTAPSMPANFWGQLYIGGNLSGAGETITVEVEALEYTTDTQDDGYYTITVPGTESDIVEFFYNETQVGSSSWAEGKIEQIDLHF